MNNWQVRLREFRQNKEAFISEISSKISMSNSEYRFLAFLEKVQELKKYAKENHIEFICSLKNCLAEIYILEPDTYLDHKRYTYSPEEPEAIKTYTKLSRYWKIIKQRHDNDPIERPYFYDGILNV